MDELLRRALITLRGMWTQRWYGLAMAWAIGLVGVAVVVLLPEKYEASARVFVNTDSILKPLMSGMTVEPNVDQRIMMLSRVLISRPNVEKLIQMGGVDTDVRTQEDRDQLVDRLVKALKIEGAGRDNLYTLTFRDPDPGRAKKVVASLASIFIQSGQGEKMLDTDAAKKFIDEQIAVYEKKLEEAENRLKDFKLRNLGLAPGEGKDYFARMSEAKATLSQAQLELSEAEHSRDAFKRQLSGDETNSGDGASSPSNRVSIQDIDARIDGMRRTLDGFLLKYTDGHPDVIGTRRAIKELEDQRRQVVATRKSGSAPVAAVPSSGGVVSAYDHLTISLGEAEARVASLRTRVAEYSSRYSALRELAKSIPELEAEHAQLNRDYDINKKNYESLVARRESANISGDMQSVSGVADFRLIDPPRVSPRPVAPTRLTLLPLALLAALVSGIAVAYVVHEMRLTFFDTKALRAATGLPILGSVSRVAADADRLSKRREFVRFLAGLGVLVATYFATIATLVVMTVRAA